MQELWSLRFARRLMLIDILMSTPNILIFYVWPKRHPYIIPICLLTLRHD